MNQKLQLIESWLFPEQTEVVKLDDEPISNKRFILMCTVTIASMIIAKLVTKL